MLNINEYTYFTSANQELRRFTSTHYAGNGKSNNVQVTLVHSCWSTHWYVNDDLQLEWLPYLYPKYLGVRDKCFLFSEKSTT